MGCMAYLLVGTGIFCLVAALPQFNLWFAALGAVFIYIGWRLINEERQASPTYSSSSGSEPLKKSYPYRPEVEKRLPNGKITTSGYAARHPHEFAHWRSGPYNVMGESIDPLDWEKWRENYYG